MKKNLLSLFLLVISLSFMKSQCVISCSNYAVASITPSLWPTTGNNAVPMFIPNTDDGYTPPVPIGFSFNYYCTTYTSVLVYTNGLIQFDIGSPSTFPFGYDAAQLIPNPSLPTVLNGIVCYRMDDLDPTVGGTVTYTTVGVTPNQAFVVTYSNVPLFGNPSLLYSGQIILHETTNMIDIHTIAAPSGPNLATQGIESPSGTLGLAVSGRNQTTWSATNDAYRFSPAYAPTAPTSLTGTTSICQGATSQFTVSSMPNATAYVWYLPASWNGTSTASTISATAGVSGQLSVAATYSCGTSTPVTLSVTVIPSPTVAVTSATPSIFCSGTTVTITTSGAINYTVQPGNYTGLPPFFDTPLVNTTYSVTGVNAAGCESWNTAMVAITVKETPTVTVNSGSVCLGAAFTMTATGANTYVYSSVFPQITPTSAGVYSYSVTGTATNGCVGDVAISTLTVYSLPVITTSITRASICTKESTSITAMGAATYSWSTNSTAPGLTVSPVTNTLYTVIGIDANGCASTGTASVKVSNCLGVNENSMPLLSVFPNPTNGDVTLKLLSETNISVYNIIGELIFNALLSEGSHHLDIREQASGTYYIIARDQQSSTRVTLLKQ